MRIGYPFVGDTIGGSHISMLPVISAGPGLGIEPVVIVHQDGPLQALLDQRGITAITPPHTTLVGAGAIPGQVAAMALAAARLAPFIRSNALSAIHTNDARMHFTWGPAARLGGAAHVWHQRSADDSRRVAQYSRLASRILTISKFCREVFAEPMGARTQVIYDPFPTHAPMPDRAAAKKALLDEFGLPADTSIVGYVGNLTRQKRPEVFVRIAAHLSRTFSGPLVCPMFGELRQPIRMELETAIGEHGLASLCRLAGPRYPIEPTIIRRAGPHIDRSDDLRDPRRRGGPRRPPRGDSPQSNRLSCRPGRS